MNGPAARQRYSTVFSEPLQRHDRLRTRPPLVRHRRHPRHRQHLPDGRRHGAPPRPGRGRIFNRAGTGTAWWSARTRASRATCWSRP
jgi:hypothetical protein